MPAPTAKQELDEHATELNASVPKTTPSNTAETSFGVFVLNSRTSGWACPAKVAGE
jgi:hypothetical protein